MHSDENETPCSGPFKLQPWSRNISVRHAGGLFQYPAAGIQFRGYSCCGKERVADIVVEKGISAIASYDREYVERLINTIARFAGVVG